MGFRYANIINLIYLIYLFKFKLINFKDGTREIWFIIIIEEVRNYILKPRINLFWEFHQGIKSFECSILSFGLCPLPSFSPFGTSIFPPKNFRTSFVTNKTRESREMIMICQST